MVSGVSLVGCVRR